jgi:hypothetical protein
VLNREKKKPERGNGRTESQIADTAQLLFEASTKNAYLRIPRRGYAIAAHLALDKCRRSVRYPGGRSLISAKSEYKLATLETIASNAARCEAKAGPTLLLEVSI